MTLVRNSYPHPYAPTVGGVMAPQGVADLTLYAQELDAIATGGLVVMDPDWVPPDAPPSPPASTGAGDIVTLPGEDVPDPALGRMWTEIQPL